MEVSKPTLSECIRTSLAAFHTKCILWVYEAGILGIHRFRNYIILHRIGEEIFYPFLITLLNKHQILFLTIQIDNSQKCYFMFRELSQKDLPIKDIFNWLIFDSYCTQKASKVTHIAIKDNKGAVTPLMTVAIILGSSKFKKLLISGIKRSIGIVKNMTYRIRPMMRNTLLFFLWALSFSIISALVKNPAYNTSFWNRLYYTNLSCTCPEGKEDYRQ